MRKYSSPTAHNCVLPLCYEDAAGLHGRSSCRAVMVEHRINNASPRTNSRNITPSTRTAGLGHPHGTRVQPRWATLPSALQASGGPHPIPTVPVKIKPTRVIDISNLQRQTNQRVDPHLRSSISQRTSTLRQGVFVPESALAGTGDHHGCCCDMGKRCLLQAREAER